MILGHLVRESLVRLYVVPMFSRALDRFRTHAESRCDSCARRNVHKNMRRKFFSSGFQVSLGASVSMYREMGTCTPAYLAEKNPAREGRAVFKWTNRARQCYFALITSSTELARNSAPEAALVAEQRDRPSDRRGARRTLSPWSDDFALIRS